MIKEREVQIEKTTRVNRMGNHMKQETKNNTTKYTVEALGIHKSIPQIQSHVIEVAKCLPR